MSHVFVGYVIYKRNGSRNRGRHSLTTDELLKNYTFVSLEIIEIPIHQLVDPSSLIHRFTRRNGTGSHPQPGQYTNRTQYLLIISERLWHFDSKRVCCLDRSVRRSNPKRFETGYADQHSGLIVSVVQQVNRNTIKKKYYLFLPCSQSFIQSLSVQDLCKFSSRSERSASGRRRPARSFGLQP